jgi:carbon-monoxide dehydrogenase large subunit
VSAAYETKRYVGSRVPRREDPRLLTGRGRFVADVVLPGLVEAMFVRSPVAAARIVSIDVEAARALDGVLAVFTGADLNRDEALWDRALPGFPFPSIQPLAGVDVRFAGDPVVLIIASDRYVAEDAAELVVVEYDERAAVIGRAQALGESEARVHPELESNVAWRAGGPPDAALEAAFAASDHLLDATIDVQRYVAAPIETRGLVADWDPASRRMTVFNSTQTPHQDQLFFAQVLGVGEPQVRVIAQDVGGGFGLKYYNSREEAAVARAARMLARPIRWIEDRHENLAAAASSRDEQLRVRLGLSRDGIIRAAWMEHVADLGAYPQNSIASGGLVSQMFPAAYRVPAYGWAAATVYTNTAGRSAYRGPWLMETVGREVVFDIAARELGLDPIELRRRNMIRADEVPYTSATGHRYERIDPLHTFESALELVDFEGFRERQAAARERGRYLGLGVGTYVEPTGMGGMPFHAEVSTVRLEATGQAVVLAATGSTGNSVETTLAQVVADQLGLALEDVTVLQGDTAVSPPGSGTGGSRSALAAGGAARIAAERVREKVLKIAAHELEAEAQDLVLEHGVVSVIGAPSSGRALSEIAKLAYTDATRLPDGMELGLEMTVRYDPPPMTYAESTHVCVCEVDVDSGLVTLLDYVVGSDCGVLINPMVVEGQLAGGIAQGIGGALLENLPYDEDGNPIAVSFKDYLLPTSEDVPGIRYVHAETPSGTPGGFKGMAEGGAIGSPPAVANAVADALSPFGLRLTRFPFDPETLVRELAAVR